VDPVPGPLLLRKSGSTGNQTQDLWICGQEQQRVHIKSVALVHEQTIPSGRRLSVKLVPTFVDRGCRVVSAMDPTAVFSVF
jgi:hypothetical protein